MAAWWRRRDIYDILAALFMLACVILILVNLSMYPVYLDIPYHMAVTEGFQEAGGITTWDFWDYAPSGRPHIYPPLLHVGMSALQDIGLSAEFTATLVCVVMFPLILLSLWWAMRKLFGSRAALYALLLVGIPYAFFYQTGITIAASLVLALTPLVFLALEEDHRIAAIVLLAMCLYSHLVLGHLVALALFIYMLHRREKWRGIMTVLVAAYVLYLPWGIVVLANLGSFSVSEPGMGGGFTLHLLLWGLAAAGFVVCYLRKKQHYLLPAYFISMVPIAFFYSHRFWEGHVLLPLAMLGGVALDRLHAFLKERLSRRASTASFAKALAAGALGVILILVLFTDPVLASSPQRPVLGNRQAVAGDVPARGEWGETSPPAGYGENAPPPTGQGHAPTPGQGAIPPPGQGGSAPPLGDDPRIRPPRDINPRGALPRDGEGMVPRQPLRAFRDRNESSFTFSMRPTTLLVLLGVEESQPRMGSRQEVFGEESMDLMEVIAGNSDPGDIVFASDGRLGDLIYAMTGRYSIQGMFHEVQPEQQADPLTEADVAVVMSGTVREPGGGFADRLEDVRGLEGWSEAGRVGIYTVLVNESSEGGGSEPGSAALPLWAAYALLLAAILLIVIDLVGGKPRYEPPQGPDSIPPREDPGAGPGRDNAVIAVVPAHNEKESIGETVYEIRRSCPGLDVVVIDDGSSDDTGREALEAGAMVIRSEENRGVGEAERRGLIYAYGRGYRYAVRLDGDGQHPASDITRLLEPLCGGYAEVVVGSRFLGGSGEGYAVSMPRRLGMSYFRTLLRLSTPMYFTDPTSGYRAYSRGAMHLLCQVEPPRYPEVTSLRLFARNGLAVREVPVRMRPRAKGRSTLGAWSALSMIVGVTLDLMRPPLRFSSPKPGETVPA